MQKPLRCHWIAALLLVMFSTLGCAPVYQVKSPDPDTGLLPTHLEVPADEILTYIPKAKVRNVRFFLVRTASGGIGNNQEFVQFFRGAVQQLGIEQIVTSEELTKMVLRSDLRDSVGNVTDPVALANISREIGPFLILDAVQVHQGYGWFQTRVRITDPEDAERLLDINRIKLNWSNLDKEVNYPVLNVIKKWIDESRSLPSDDTSTTSKDLKV